MTPKNLHSINTVDSGALARALHQMRSSATSRWQRRHLAMSALMVYAFATTNRADVAPSVDLFATLIELPMDGVFSAQLLTALLRVWKPQRS